ncbi:TonB-dependent receptor [Pedobacter sp. P351]|uniref:TonB-dependent receptor n=1 Tax=Pedobacter superstes TaxID=3133441 RepID=UPI0030B7243D
MHQIITSKLFKIALCLVLYLPLTLQAQVIKGSVTGSDGFLPGVNILTPALKKNTATDLSGSFTLNIQTTGRVSILIDYIGYESKRIDLDLKQGVNDVGVIQLLPAANTLGAVTINGTMAPSQAKAYNIKKNSLAVIDVIAADAIGKLPDRNAAEAVQRMQGVAVARYHGEADQATVRGTPFAWTSTLFNGTRLPSSNVLGNRSSVLDAVPSEIIQYVQVAKALTPDWEGDAIGGAINFITRTAPVKRQFNISGAGGYNTFSQNGTYNASGVYGDRFFKNKLGVILAGAIWDRQWGTDSYDVNYNTGLANPVQQRSINTVMFKRYMGKRQTYGANLGLEYKFNVSNKLLFRGLMDKFNDIRPVYESYVDYTNSRYQYNYRYSHYQTKLNGAELGGEHQLTSNIKLDWTASNYLSNYFLETPSTNSSNGLPISTFRQKINGGFNNLSSDGKRYWEFDSPDAIGGTPTSFDAGLKNPSEVMDDSKLMLQQLVIAQLDTKEEDRTAQINTKINVSSTLNLKFGGKYRHKFRRNTYGSNLVFAPGTNSPAMSLNQLDRGDFPEGDGYFKGMNGSYNQYIVNPVSKQQLFNLYSPESISNNGFRELTSATNATSLYSGTEEVAAAYIMAEFDFTEKLKFVGGFRNEFTQMDLNGSKAVTAGTPAQTTITPAEVNTSYNAFLPMFHLKYAVNKNSNIRAAYTRTFVRPNFNDMTPGQSIDNTRNPITLTKGNTDLKPTFSNNLDLMGEHYFNNIGLLSGGVFYKNIKNAVFTDKTFYTSEGDNYVLTQAKNIKDGSLFGFEAGINKRLDFLKGIWSGLGVEFNYTYINSEIEIPRTTATASFLDKTSLPNQSKNLYNAILFYERSGLMLRLAGNYRGKSVESINQQLGPDFYIWTDKNFTLDASATVSINKKMKAFAEFNNLTDEPLRTYMGDRRRVTMTEWYGSRGQIGLRWNIIP